MDYFYLSSKKLGGAEGTQSMSTKELRRKLERLGKSSKGARNVLLKRYDMYASELDPEDGSSRQP